MEKQLAANHRRMTNKSPNLVASTRQVFDECASIYLREDKHWGCDLDIIAGYVERFSDPEILEFGTGYAWHLANLYFLVNAKIRRALGVDYSAEMLANARAFLVGIQHNGRTMLENVELRQADILDIGLASGSFDVGLLLNNTLGNLPGETFEDALNERKRALWAIRGALRAEGYLIVSVYNADRLSAEDTYGDVFELDHDLSKLDTMDLVVRFKKTKTPYYSHWFTPHEVRQLLYEASFRIVQVEERQKRVVIVAQKKKRAS